MVALPQGGLQDHTDVLAVARRSSVAGSSSCAGGTRGRREVLARLSLAGSAAGAGELQIPRYPGVRQPETAAFAEQLGEFLRAGGHYPWQEVERLVEDARELVHREATLERLQVPAGGHINVIGDVHGQFFDIFTIWEQNGLPAPNNPYLFNGDMVDRGSYGVEILLVLFAWKAAYPEHVHLARGNHELASMNRYYGFRGEVLSKYGQKEHRAYSQLQSVLDLLPLAHVINGAVFVVHGGLPRIVGAKLEEIEQLERAGESDNQLFTDLLWADPRDRKGFGMSSRGGNLLTFGPDVTEAFLQANHLQFLIRSHEVKQKGYEWTHNNKCLTVFSAPNYCDSCRNLGAVARLGVSEDGQQLKVELRLFEEAEKPAAYVPSMAYASDMM